MGVEPSRVQTGLRLEKRVLQVAKGTAEYLDMSLGDLVEGVLLHAFEGSTPFGRETLEKIAALRGVYDLTLTASDAHRFPDVEPGGGKDGSGRR